MTDKNQAIEFTKKIMKDMDCSPTPFHAVNQISKIYKDNGFTEIDENSNWKVKPGGKYFFTRNMSTIAAFIIPESDKINGFMIATSHGDYPGFKLMDTADRVADEKFVIANVDPYTRSQKHSWVDVPLSVAGKLMVKTETGFETKLVNIKRPLLMIPSLAAHMQEERDIDPKIFDYEKHMQPIFSTDTDAKVLDVIAAESSVKVDDIIDFELYVYRYSNAMLWGANNEFISSRAIDNQINAYCSAYALCECKPTESIAINIVFDNEEVGSKTVQGAESSLLTNMLEKISKGLGVEKDGYKNLLANSLILSADNTHSVHPNYTDKHNHAIKTYLGQGVAIKVSASTAYGTTAVSGAMVRKIAENNNIKLQVSTPRAGIRSGGTLAQSIAPQSSINACDVGLAQLSMHSAYETCSTYDAVEMKKLIIATFNSSIKMESDGQYIVK